MPGMGGNEGGGKEGEDVSIGFHMNQLSGYLLFLLLLLLLLLLWMGSYCFFSARLSGSIKWHSMGVSGETFVCTKYTHSTKYITTHSMSGERMVVEVVEVVAL